MNDSDLKRLEEKLMHSWVAARDSGETQLAARIWQTIADVRTKITMLKKGKTH
jgi:hypothetical protein